MSHEYPKVRASDRRFYFFNNKIKHRTHSRQRAENRLETAETKQESDRAKCFGLFDIK